ncbi:hypothetical protein IQ268_14425 [Oculatella sp. LEGE 06141]|uniref:hypothetical protein n=1 Tax=Oculatella sp. LEGE 06141 TaxID=1828648 RepID=UPI00187EABD7|nr:hypothetical protein [Oculatella sp. LEGE 06141]MBE9179762.1 hypothetical protein [Oculatella sp. LEGE 06141]
MLEMPKDKSNYQNYVEPTPIFVQKLVERCHIALPDTPKPTSAIFYEGQFYAYVRFFSSVDVARQKAALMTARGNNVILTRVPRGLVMWVHEPEARLAQKSSTTP